MSACIDKPEYTSLNTYITASLPFCKKLCMDDNHGLNNLKPLDACKLCQGKEPSQEDVDEYGLMYTSNLGHVVQAQKFPDNGPCEYLSKNLPGYQSGTNPVSLSSVEELRTLFNSETPRDYVSLTSLREELDSLLNSS